MIERIKRGKPKKQAIGDTTRFQKKNQKQRKDDLISKWYDPRLSLQENVKMFMDNGIKVSKSRLQQWTKEYIQ